MKVYNMKILLMSDTHGEQEAARRILQEHAAADLKIHLGDVGFPLQEIDECSIVKGNHDRSHRLPKKLKLTLEGRKAICLHGDIFDDETVQEVLAMKHAQNDDIMDLCMRTLYGKLAAYAKRKGCDTLFFGHTHHQSFTEVDGVVLINPGSVCYGTPHSGYGVVEIHGCCIRAQLLAVENC